MHNIPKCFISMTYCEYSFKCMFELNIMALPKNLSTISKHSIAKHSEIVRIWIVYFTENGNIDFARRKTENEIKLIGLNSTSMLIYVSYPVDIQEHRQGQRCKFTKRTFTSPKCVCLICFIANNRM